MAALTQSEIKVLEQTRQRLSQLTNSLSSLKQNLLQSDPLPPWSSLQSLASIISTNLSSVSNHLISNGPLLASMNIFPLSNYPGKTQEALLGQLLRKKLEPGVEDWVAEGYEVAQKAGMEQQEVRNEYLDLWSWAGMAANELARGHEWGGEYTQEEREMGVENVITGLKRRLGDEDEDEEDEDEEAKEVKSDSDVKMKDQTRTEQDKGNSVDDVSTAEPIEPLPLEQVLRFMVRGTDLPK